MSRDLLAFFPDEMVSVVLTSFSDGVYDADGKWQPGTPTTRSIRIIDPQPATADQLALMPEGEEVTDSLTTYTKEVIKTRATGQDADEITWRGVQYKVMQVNDRVYAGGFYRLLINKKDGQ